MVEVLKKAATDGRGHVQGYHVPGDAGTRDKEAADFTSWRGRREREIADSLRLEVQRPDNHPPQEKEGERRIKERFLSRKVSR